MTVGGADCGLSAAAPHIPHSWCENREALAGEAKAKAKAKAKAGELLSPQGPSSQQAQFVGRQPQK